MELGVEQSMPESAARAGLAIPITTRTVAAVATSADNRRMPSSTWVVKMCRHPGQATSEEGYDADSDPPRIVVDILHGSTSPAVRDPARHAAPALRSMTGSVDTALRHDPLHRLTRHGCDQIEVTVVVHDDGIQAKSGRGDEEVGELTASQPTVSKVSLHDQGIPMILIAYVHDREDTKSHLDLAPLAARSCAEAEFEARQPADPRGAIGKESADGVSHRRLAKPSQDTGVEKMA